MKNEDKKSKRKLYLTDYIVIGICVVAAIALLAIIIVSNYRTNQEQQQLQEVQEQLQQELDNDADTGEIASGLILSEVNQAGWVEFCNTSSKTVLLSGLKLSIDGVQVLEIEDNSLLAPRETAVYDFTWEQGEQSHVLVVETAERERVFSMMFPFLSEGQSYGYVQDKEFSILTATKGEPNTKAEKINQQDIVFSAEGGFYEDSVTLEITAPEGTMVYYTTDATEPSQDSTRYDKPIEVSPKSSADFVYAASEGIGYEYLCEPSNVNMGTVIRAIAVDTEGNIVCEKSASYYIGLGNNSDMLDMPVISITTNPEGLFDYFEGMYVSGRSYEDALAAGKEEPAGNYYNDWERSAYIEYFEPNKDKTYGGNVTLKMLDNCNTTSAQKGFELISIGDEVNRGSSFYEYFDGKRASVMLQAYLSDNKYRVREQIAEKLLEQEDIGLHKAVPCNVFVDGEYWGNYLLKVPYSCNYIYRTEKLWDPTDVVISVNGVVSDDAYQQMYNDMYAFIVDSDMSVESNYREAEKLIDMESYLNYICINMYLANVNFGELECAWRPVTNHGIEQIDSKWHWMIGNLDNTMENSYSGNLATASIDTYYQQNVTGNKFFCSLLKSPYFREALQAKMTELAQETFSKEKADAAVDEVSAKMQKASISSAKRFLGEPADNFWTLEMNEIKAFFDKRGAYILKYTAEIVEDGCITMR